MYRPQQTPFNSGWRFHFDTSPPSDAPPHNTAHWLPVDLPHSWNSLDTMEPDVTRHYRRGVGSYTKTYTPPALPHNHRVWLQVEAAAMKARVYLGAQRIGEHVGGYTSFTLELPARSQLNADTPLTFHVDNRPDINLIPSDMSDFFLYGGLTRNLWLYTTGPVRLDNLFFDVDTRPEEASIGLRGKLVGKTDQQLKLSIKLTGPDGTLLYHIHRTVNNPHFEFELPAISNPHLWSPKDPALYTATINLIADDDVWDTVQTQLGCRFFDFPVGGAFYLNGERLLLKGTHRHEDWAGHAAAVPDELTRQELEMIRQAGFNFIRLGHYPQSPVVLNACNRLGLLVWEELPWCRGGIGGDLFKEQTRNMLAQMIEQHYNHPSIIFWGLGNELDWESEHPDSTDEKVLEFLQELHDLSHKLDSRRLTALRRFEPGAAVVDVYSPSIWSGWYRGRYQDYETALTDAITRYPRMFHAEWGGDSHVGRHNSGPHLPVEVAVETDHAEVPGLALSTSGPNRASRDSDWSESYMLDVMEWHLQVQQRLPNLAGTAQWVFKDFGTPLRPENPVPYVNQKGLVDRAGQPKDLYFLFQAYLADTPVCYIESPTWPVRVGAAGETQRVRVYSNCPRVELFVNGQSAGQKARNPQAFPAAGLVWQAALLPGKNQLRAVGFCDNGTTIEHTIEQQYVAGPVGPPQTFSARVEPAPSLFGNNAFRITLQLVDAQNRPIVDDNRRVKFSVTGAKQWLYNLGISDGCQEVTLANGRASVLVTPAPDSNLIVTIEAEGLPKTDLHKKFTSKHK